MKFVLSKNGRTDGGKRTTCGAEEKPNPISVRLLQILAVQRPDIEQMSQI